MAWKTKDGDLFEGTSLQAPRCYESHPTLKMGNGDLCGGSASWPVVKDADIYVALQKGSSSDLVSDPWSKQQVVEIHFGIQDQHAPTNVARFKKMIDWLCNQLHEGKKVHVGCIGGHGRTGTVLAAIVAQMLKKKDAIQYVRKHYCPRAVESAEQINFLIQHYGVSKVESSKHHFEHRSGGHDGTQDVLNRHNKKHATTFGGGPKNPVFAYGSTVAQASHIPVLTADRPPKQLVPKGFTSDVKTFAPLASERCIWRRRR